jgi:hypothetical protein
MLVRATKPSPPVLKEQGIHSAYVFIFYPDICLFRTEGEGLRIGFSGCFRGIKPIHNALLFKQSAGYIRRYCTVTEPAQRFVGINGDDGRLYARIVMPDVLDEATIARRGAVRHDNSIEGTLFRAHALQSNLD